MKRLVSVCCILITCCLVLFNTDANAQGIRIKVDAINSTEYPAGVTATGGAFPISGGLRVFPVNMREYFVVDTTGAGLASITWSLTAVPGGSTATLNRTDTLTTYFKADIAGTYSLKVTVGTKTDTLSVLASTYAGTPVDKDCGTCHSRTSPMKAAYTAWSTSNHATMFRRGISGLLETNANPYDTVGVYNTSCVKCHTQGWDQTANNGNFGYVAHLANGPTPAWDTTWYKGPANKLYSGEYLIQVGDTTNWTALKTNYPALVGGSTIGCEQCHGPAATHVADADPTEIAVRRDAGVCEVCHTNRAGTKHDLGWTWEQSMHAKLPDGSHTAQPGCYPCHSGAAFIKWVKNNKSATTVYDTTTVNGHASDSNDGNIAIGCPTCHEPHSLSLRTEKLDSLRNGQLIPATLGGAGQLCANCHNARYSVKARVTNNRPYYGFVDRFGPHHNNQADMYYGGNAYQYDDTSFTGLMTHGSAEDACVTCHMTMGYNASSPLNRSHSMIMADTAGVPTATGLAACAPCHGTITSYDGIKAYYDFDRNGKIDGVQTEIAGLLAQLKARLPKDATGEVISMKKDFDTTATYANKKNVGDIYNYWFFKEDRSLGVHNPKYALRLLYKALGWTPLWVKDVPGSLPTDFALNQNYPNPFNPSTVIRFSLPTEQQVKLDVYDMSGALVKTVLNEAVRAGNKEVTWDGTNGSGAKVASGVYLYRLQAGSFTSVKKMIMLK
jgi:hypothetical protein